MGNPTTPLPTQKAFGQDEPSVLLGYLDYHRTVLVRKAEGITDDQARLAACPPSELTLMGLIRHMADVERYWFRRRLAGEDIGPIYSSEDPDVGDPDGDLHPGPDDTMAATFAAWRAEVAEADANIAAASLDDVERTSLGNGEPGSLRRVIVHLIEEYARHCGHADLLRQAVDGTTGD